ncbi:MAG TPA: hypothetical protein VKJ45_05880 [Blastocatellia bacterium]|nr:hypothetical protein [Blastocatellia bacterium]
MNEKTETTTKAKQRGAAMTEVIFAISTLAAAVLVGAMMGLKYPDKGGD